MKLINPEAEKISLYKPFLNKRNDQIYEIGKLIVKSNSNKTFLVLINITKQTIEIDLNSPDNGDTELLVKELLPTDVDKLYYLDHQDTLSKSYKTELQNWNLLTQN